MSMRPALSDEVFEISCGRALLATASAQEKPDFENANVMDLRGEDKPTTRLSARITQKLSRRTN
jgi:hypothetical protein